MAKSVARVLGFFLVLAIAIMLTNGVLRFKYGDGIIGMELLYEQPEDSIDVLCIGSSRVFENINTGVLWDEYGIASYDLAGSIQPFWNSYYYLNEALKTQHPKVIVVDMFWALQVGNYSDPSRIAKNTFGMIPSLDMLEAKRVSSPPDDLLEYVLEFPHYHSRYSDLTSEDFLPYQGIANREHWKGSGINTTTGILAKNPDVTNVSDRTPLSEKSEEYLLKIISLAESEGVPLVFVCAPGPIEAAEQAKYNYIGDLAREYNVPFLNYNTMLDEVGLNFATEKSDLASDGHLNHRGTVKYSKHLGNWLKNRYGLGDHRGDPRYQSWQIDADNCRSIIWDQSVRETTELSSWLSESCANEHCVVMGYCGKNADDNIVAAFSGAAGGGQLARGSLFVIDGGEIVFESDADSVEWQGGYGLTKLMASREGGKSVLSFNHDNYESNDSSLTMIAYDRFDGSFVEASTWNISPESKAAAQPRNP